jgi:two-component system response regulator AtoC
MTKRRLLIVDDEEGVRDSLAFLLADEGYCVRTAGDAEEALRAAAAESLDVVLCDVRMPGRSGLQLLPELLETQPEATILMMSAYGAVEQALEAVRLGAEDYLAKPFQPGEVLLAIRKAEERQRLRRENRRLRRELGEERSGQTLVAASAAMQEVIELVERAAEYKTTVLITGESGVGKEVVARTIHELSGREAQPFIAVNCAAIPESLIESELFGHARGAFTGAEAPRPGLFREADSGTLFLDEIGELSAPLQVKLLRVLQEGEVRPVGEAKAIPVDVRIVAATARDLEADVAADRFRDDLYYRLNVLRICVPPLRERPEDIPVLADHLLGILSRRFGKAVPPLESDTLERLRGHAWPGNVRELENALERAVILAGEGGLAPELFPFGRQDREPPGEVSARPPRSVAIKDADLSIKQQTRDLEERLIRLALQRTGGNRTRAARLLEISPRGLQYKLKEYGLVPAQSPAPRSR